MKMYVVKSVRKEEYLPFRKGSNSKAELCDPKEGAPRLFHSYKGAVQAMRAWLKGIHRGHGNWESDDDPYSSACYFVVDKVTVTPQRHRYADDVMVVQWNIEEEPVNATTIL